MNEFYWSFQQTRFHGNSWVPANFNRVMIIIHGIGEHLGRYAHVAEYFTTQGFAVVGIDHYGHGLSDGKRGASKGYEFTFDYLSAFLQHIKDTYHLPVVMYGHSMGGGILMSYLLKRKPAIQAAVVSAPALIVADGPGTVLKSMLKVLSKVVPNFTIKQGLDINKISHDPKQVTKFEQDPLRHDKLSLRLANDMIQYGAWSIAHADELKIPTLLIHGTADAFTAVEGSRSFAGKAPKQWLTYREWEGMYHELHNEPENREVLSFISGWLSNVN
ncbi:lysophospholipase [Chitinophaga silvatica]|uniref:Lysophospholipase n=1 Tax=Chitinophaga silvatica TaxID=2282649 RepID=A0A3E1YG68_9BACT|nr:alpha/beta hydrolase [Chitinophaga silvatica]RFS26405.1 lysophospholipase [Chitinophaga silvatica]